MSFKKSLTLTMMLSFGSGAMASDIYDGSPFSSGLMSTTSLTEKLNEYMGKENILAAVAETATIDHSLNGFKAELKGLQDVCYNKACRAGLDDDIVRFVKGLGLKGVQADDASLVPAIVADMSLEKVNFVLYNQHLLADVYNYCVENFGGMPVSELLNLTDEDLENYKQSMALKRVIKYWQAGVDETTFDDNSNSGLALEFNTLKDEKYMQACRVGLNKVVFGFFKNLLAKEALFQDEAALLPAAIARQSMDDNKFVFFNRLAFEDAFNYIKQESGAVDIIELLNYTADDLESYRNKTALKRHIQFYKDTAIAQDVAVQEWIASSIEE